MDELIKQLSTILRGMWKYRRLGVAACWVVALVGAVLVFMMQDRYEASARVYVDTQTILRPLMSGLAVQPDVEQQVAMLSRTLISRPTVEKLIRTADLDLGTRSKAEQEALVDEVMKSIQIRMAGRDNLYTLAYRDDTPERAQRVVQALMTIFVESSMGASRTDSDTARRFLDEQIKAYEGKLIEAETRLKEFKLKYIAMQTQGEMDAAGRVSDIASSLNAARLELREAESARDAARRQLEMVRPKLSDPTTPVATPELDARIEAQKRNLDDLLQRFTDQHPDVANTRRLIRDLEEQKRREIAALRQAAASSPRAVYMDTSPAVMEYKSILAAAELQVASLRARVSEYAARADRAKEQMKVAPQVEAELSQLNRDYEIHRKNYNDLVARRESANLSGQLENASNFADFRVIDPPRAASKPVAPNRLLLLPLALLAGLAAGLGLTFLLSQLRPVFFEASALRSATELPLLGVVSLVAGHEHRQAERRSIKRFAGALLALVALFAVGMATLAYQTGSFS